MGRERQPARLILIRHLETPGVQVRGAVKADPQYRHLLSFFESGRRHLGLADQAEAEDLGREFLGRYSHTVKEAVLPLLPGQEEIGRELGRSLAGRYRRIRRWEISPYLRTRQTSALLREGASEIISLPRERRNRRIREINFGDSQTYPSKYVFLATHPYELLRYLAEGKDNYKFPNGESRKGFRERIKWVALSLEWRRKYRETTVMVAHSAVIEELVMRLTGINTFDSVIPTGSATILEADKKRWFRPRKYRLVSELGAPLVPAAV